MPGELAGTFNPVDYGFGVIHTEPLTRQEQDVGVASLYRRARARTGVAIPALDPYLVRESYDPEPARALIAKHDELTYPYVCTFGGAELEIDEGVFCPTLTNASPFLLTALRVKPGERVLDAFSGSAAFGVHAALCGADVVAFDTSDLAVRCATKNALLNNVAGNVDVRLGTLNQVVAPDEKFDLIIANPPLIPGEPSDALDAALFDAGLQATVDLIVSLPTHLSRKGRCYLLTSDVIDRNGYTCNISQLCRQSGLKMSIVAQLHRDYESYRVHKIEKRSLLSFLA